MFTPRLLNLSISKKPSALIYSHRFLSLSFKQKHGGGCCGSGVKGQISGIEPTKRNWYDIIKFLIEINNHKNPFHSQLDVLIENLLDMKI